MPPLPPALAPILRPALGRMGRAGGAATKAAIGLIYPPSCVSCGGATGEAHGLCAAC